MSIFRCRVPAVDTHVGTRSADATNRCVDRDHVVALADHALARTRDPARPLAIRLVRRRLRAFAFYAGWARARRSFAGAGDLSPSPFNADGVDMVRRRPRRHKPPLQLIRTGP